MTKEGYIKVSDCLQLTPGASVFSTSLDSRDLRLAPLIRCKSRSWLRARCAITAGVLILEGKLTTRPTAVVTAAPGSLQRDVEFPIPPSW